MIPSNRLFGFAAVKNSENQVRMPRTSLTLKAFPKELTM